MDYDSEEMEEEGSEDSFEAKHGEPRFEVIEEKMNEPTLPVSKSKKSKAPKAAPKAEAKPDVKPVKAEKSKKKDEKKAPTPPPAKS